MTTVLRHASELNVPPEGTRYMWIEIIQDTTYTIKFTIHAPSNRNHCCEKYIRDIPYIPSPMLELIKLIQFQPCDPIGDKVYQTLSTIFNSTLQQTMKKEYESIENKTLQRELDTLKNENEKLTQNVEEQTHKITCTHHALLQATATVIGLEKELTTAQSTIKNLSQDLDDTTTELKIWESKCIQYEDELYELQEINQQSLDNILENALDEL